MKKTLILTALLVLVVSALAAQESSPAPKLSMWNRGVFNFNLSDKTTSVGPGWSGPDTGMYNSLSLDWTWKDVSWTMTGQWDDDAWSLAKNLRDFSGTFSMFSGFLRFTGGKVWSDGGYRFTNFDTTGFATRIATGKTGFMIRVQPVAGLSVGAFVPVPVPAQPMATTFGAVNLGAEILAGKAILFRTSYRFEKDGAGNREFAVGARLLAVKNFELTLGYRYLDVAVEHDLFMDTMFRIPHYTFRFYGDVNFRAGGPFYGGKVNAEHEIGKTPFVLGASASYGNGDVWYNDGLAAAAYVRYGFPGGSSVQVGADVAHKTDYRWRAQIQYTVGF